MKSLLYENSSNTRPNFYKILFNLFNPPTKSDKWLFRKNFLNSKMHIKINKAVCVSVALHFALIHDYLFGYILY